MSVGTEILVTHYVNLVFGKFEEAVCVWAFGAGPAGGRAHTYSHVPAPLEHPHPASV